MTKTFDDGNPGPLTFLSGCKTLQLWLRRYRPAMKTLSSGRRASISSADRKLPCGFSCSEILDGLWGSTEGVLLRLQPERIFERRLAAVGEQ